MVFESLSDALRDATAALHREAERSGIIHDLLTRQADRAGFATLLQNLLPVYEALEAGLERHRQTALLGPLARPAVYRAAALRADLVRLGGSPTLLPEGQAYAAAVARATQFDLMGFAYVRYMGDLSGGQILSRLLGRSLGLTEIAFYAFPEIADPQRFRDAYRQAIDQSGGLIADHSPILAAAKAAFRLDIALSNAIARYTANE